MSQIEDQDLKVKFTRNGVEILEKIEPKLGDGGPQYVVNEEYTWEEFPKSEINMSVTGIDYEKSGDSESSLKSLEFAVDKIEKQVQQTDNETGTAEDFWQKVQQDVGIEYNDGDVILDESKSGKKNLVDFVKFLDDNNLIPEDELPVTTGGYERYIINTVPEHSSKDMTTPEEVGGWIYVETNNPTNKKKEFIKKLGERFGANND